MSNACIKFFSISDLVCALSPFLSQRDLSQLMQVNYTLNENLQHFFWRSIDLQDQKRALRFLNSPETIHALTKNASLVHSLTASNDFLIYFLHGLHNRPEIAPPQWLPNYTVSPDYSVPLPLFTQLTRLHCKIENTIRYIPPRSISFVDPHSKPYLDPLHVFWIVSFHPTLRHLTVDGLEYQYVSHLIGGTVRMLNQLTHLDLHSPEKITLIDLDEIFFNCPPTLESLMFYAEIRFDRAYLLDVAEVIGNDQENIEGFEQTPRVEPLKKLKKLRLPMPYILGGYSPTSITSILEHCPALESWTAIDFIDDTVNEAAANAVALHCKKIRHVTVLSNPYCNRPEIIIQSLMGLPKDQLEILEFMYLHFSSPCGIFPRFLQHHSLSLREIVFEGISFIEGRFIGLILSTCLSLELLMVRCNWKSDFSIAPKDLIEFKWVCHNLKHLELFVEIQEDDTSTSNQAELEHAEFTEKKDTLARLYQQIGQMTRLRILDLKRKDAYASVNVYYHQVSLPRLLTLYEGDGGDGDEMESKGCLSMLADLTELRELRGSVSSETPEVSKMMGFKEVEWMAKHWPALEVAEFLPSGYDDIPEHLLWLQGQYRKLKFHCL